MRMIRGFMSLVALFGSVVVPQAAAEPQFPNLDDFVEVDGASYQTYHSYGESGSQFVTPDGVHCRYMVNVRGGALDLMCWGSLPGVSDGMNEVFLHTNGGDLNPGGAGFTTSHMQTYGQRDDGLPGRPHLVPVTERDYPLLSPGHKLVVSKMGGVMTCAVGNGGMTACQIELPSREGRDAQGHGFVLSPEGSWTF